MFLVKTIKRKYVTPIKRTRASSYIKRRVSGDFDGELEAKQVKMIGCHVPRAPVPERLARLP